METTGIGSQPPLHPASERLDVFLKMLPKIDPDKLISPPGLGGTWRARYIQEGVERGILVVHSSGMGLAILLPKTHGVCPECAASKRRTICDHCSCSMCAWERRADERVSPRVSREKLQKLARRIQALTFAAPKPAEPVTLDEAI